MQALRGGGDFVLAKFVAEFVVPIQAAYAVHGSIPKRSGRRLEVGVCVQPWLLMENTSCKALVEIALG
jgi:hypothetical protein